MATGGDLVMVDQTADAPSQPTHEEPSTEPGALGEAEVTDEDDKKQDDSAEASNEPEDKSKRTCFEKMIYWRVGLLQPPSIPDSDNKFEAIFAKTNAALHSVLLPFAIITFIVLFVNLITRWDVDPRWRERIPCTFQKDMSDFFDHHKAAVRALLVLDLFPAGCAIVCCVLYLHGRPGNAEAFTNKKRPLIGWLALGWFWKVLVPLLMFTFINFKEPTYIPYGTVTKKACEVVLSLTFNPPGASTNAYISTKYSNLRTVTGSYFGNSLNYLYPSESGFESSLSTVGTDTWSTTETDSNAGCNYVDDDSSFFSDIAKFINVPASIENYCDKGYDITSNDRDKGPLWPVTLLTDHMQNYVNGLAILQHACKGGAATTTQGDPATDCTANTNNAITDGAGCKEKLPDASITTATTEGVTLYDVCKHWYTCTTWACCKDETITKADGTESTITGKQAMACVSDDYTAGTGTAIKTAALSTEAHRQAVCLLHPTMYDPQVGYQALASLLCPASTTCTDTTKGCDTTKTVTDSSSSLTTAVATQDAIDAASVTSLGQARDRLTTTGFSGVFPTNNYTGFAKLIREDATSMITDVTTDQGKYDRAAYLRWTEQDGVAMMQIAMAYMKTQLQTSITTLTNLGAGITGAQIEAELAKEFLSLGKNIDVAMYHSMYNVARKASLSTSSAINKIGQLVGIFAGFMAVMTLVPFAVSVLTGMISGAKTVKAMIKSSDCMADERDTRKVNTFLAMILTNSVAIVALPLVAIPIFIYQAFADQTFVMSVLGFMIVVMAFFVGNFDTWTQQGNRNWYIFGAEIFGWFLIFLGVLLWLIYDEFSILRDAINFLVDKFFILIIIAVVIVHVLSDLIDPETLPSKNHAIALFVFKCVWLVLSIIFGLLFFAEESGDWAMFIDALQMFITWIFNSKLTALVTMNTTVLVLGKMFEDFDVVQYRGDAEEGKPPVDSGLHQLMMYDLAPSKEEESKDDCFSTLKSKMCPCLGDSEEKRDDGPAWFKGTKAEDQGDATNQKEDIFTSTSTPPEEAEESAPAEGGQL